MMFYKGFDQEHPLVQIMNFEIFLDRMMSQLSILNEEERIEIELSLYILGNISSFFSAFLLYKYKCSQ